MAKERRIGYALAIYPDEPRCLLSLSTYGASFTIGDAGALPFKSLDEIAAYRMSRAHCLNDIVSGLSTIEIYEIESVHGGVATTKRHYRTVDDRTKVRRPGDKDETKAQRPPE